MRVTLINDPSLLPDLLAFLRGAGCAAFYEGGGIEVIRPHLFGADETRAVRTIVRRWWDEHPEAQIEMAE
jgi:hypothetical protein